MPRQEVYQSWAVFESNRILEPGKKKEKGGCRGERNQNEKTYFYVDCFAVFQMVARSCWQLHHSLFIQLKPRVRHVCALTSGDCCPATAPLLLRRMWTQESLYPKVRINHSDHHRTNQVGCSTAYAKQSLCWFIREVKASSEHQCIRDYLLWVESHSLDTFATHRGTHTIRATPGMLPSILDLGRTLILSRHHWDFLNSFNFFNFYFYVFPWVFSCNIFRYKWCCHLELQVRKLLLLICHYLRPLLLCKRKITLCDSLTLIDVPAKCKEINKQVMNKQHFK